MVHTAWDALARLEQDSNFVVVTSDYPHEELRPHKEKSALFFFGIALFLGIGFGTMFPAFNTLFVNLAPHNQRGTATSTYLTSWDVGIGAGLLLGGYLGEITTLDRAYLFGACLTIVSMLYFNIKVTPHYHKNKLRGERKNVMKRYSPGSGKTAP